MQTGQDGEHDDRDQKQHHVHCSNVVNFYFTNFPPEWDKVNLYELFSEVGEIAHIYVARKVSKAGKRFGFARFFRVGNVLALGKRLNRIRIGTFKLSANVARFEKSISKPKMGCEKDTWAFEIPSKSNKSRSYSSSPSVSHTKFRNTLDGKSFVIHSPLELQSIWSYFNVTKCKVKFLGGSRFSLELNNSRDNEEENSGFAIFGSEDSVEGDEIKKGSNLGGCRLKNESTGMTQNSITTKQETINDVVKACSGCEKSKADQEYCFPAQVFETENLKFESKGCSECDNVNKSDDKKEGGTEEVTSPSSAEENKVEVLNPRPITKDLKRSVTFVRGPHPNLSSKDETLISHGEKVVTVDDFLEKKGSEKNEAADSSTFPAKGIQRDILNLKKKLHNFQKISKFKVA